MTDLKQCADKNLRTKFRERSNSLYLAFLIGRAKSTPSYAFLRFLQTSSAPCLAASIASSVRHQHGRDLHSRRGPCVPSRSAPGLSHALHQVRKQGCPSSPALSSPKGGSRQEIADIPRFAAPPGDAHGARGSLILAPPQHAGCNTSANLSCSCSSYCVGFNRNRCVILAPKPTWKSVSLTHILCRIPAGLRATATIAHSMLDLLAIRRLPGPQCRPFPDP